MTKITRTILCVAILVTSQYAIAVDRALHNVTGYTSSDAGLVAFSILIFNDDGHIVAVGDEDLLDDYPDVERIDGLDRYVLPGLHDAHGHVSSQGFLNVELSVTGTESLEEAVARIAAYDQANPGSDWIKGRGWNQVLWPVKEFPTATAIDAVVADRPVWLRRIDGHAGWANSKALELAGIDKDTPDPVGGKILRDDNGEAAGTLIDNAMQLVSSKVPPSSKEEIRKASAH